MSRTSPVTHTIYTSRRTLGNAMQAQWVGGFALHAVGEHLIFRDGRDVWRAVKIGTPMGTFVAVGSIDAVTAALFGGK